MEALLADEPSWRREQFRIPPGRRRNGLILPIGAGCCAPPACRPRLACRGLPVQRIAVTSRAPVGLPTIRPGGRDSRGNRADRPCWSWRSARRCDGDEPWPKRPSASEGQLASPSHRHLASAIRDRPAANLAVDRLKIPLFVNKSRGGRRRSAIGRRSSPCHARCDQCQRGRGEFPATAFLQEQDARMRRDFC